MMKRVVWSIIKLVVLIICLTATTLVYITGSINDSVPNSHVHVMNTDSVVSLIKFEVVDEMPVEYVPSSTTTKIPETSVVTTTTYPVTTTQKHTTTSSKSNYVDISQYGRLCIPELNVNVALYNSSEQYITDRQDSANIFMNSNDNFLIIADHNTQAFANLHKVQVGTIGYIDSVYTVVGRRIIKCVSVLDGHNMGTELTDLNGNEIHSDSDYLMYTCKDCSKNIIVCLWDIIEYQKIPE